MMTTAHVMMTMRAAEVAQVNIITPLKKRKSIDVMLESMIDSQTSTFLGTNALDITRTESDLTLNSVPTTSPKGSSKSPDLSKSNKKLSGDFNNSPSAKKVSFMFPIFGKNNNDSEGIFKSIVGEAGKEDDFKYDLSQFEQVKQVGSGAFGRVHLCVHKKTGEKVVLKVVKKQHVLDAGHLDHVKAENETMNHLSAKGCPFVVKTLGTFQDDRNIYFVLEHVGGGELFSHLRSSKNHRFTEKRARFYIAELIVALEYMHDQANVIYRDLKSLQPENILLDDNGHVKVIDFGFAKHVGESMTYTFCGTPDYLAPEVINGKGYNKLADYWAMGVFIYELVVGHAPFIVADKFGNPSYNAILNGIYGLPKYLSPEVKSLIVGLLTVDPSRRLGFTNGIADIKDHSWFKSMNWNLIGEKKIRPPKPGRYKKGLAQPSVVGTSSEIDQSLFAEFDTVVKMDGDSLIAHKISNQRSSSTSFTLGISDLALSEANNEDTDESECRDSIDE